MKVHFKLRKEERERERDEDEEGKKSYRCDPMDESLRNEKLEEGDP